MWQAKLDMWDSPTLLLSQGDSQVAWQVAQEMKEPPRSLIPIRADLRGVRVWKELSSAMFAAFSAKLD